MGVKEDQEALSKAEEESKYNGSEDSLSEEEEEKSQTVYELNEMLDVVDRQGNLTNGEVVALKSSEVRIHYNGFPDKFDEWIHYKSPRLQKQWKKEEPFKINNRIDFFLEQKGIWLEAKILDIGFSHVKIGFPFEKTEVFLDKNSDKIEEIGSFSDAFGSGNGRKNSKKLKHKIVFDEKRFHTELASKGLFIKEVGGDGNCLFRAVSDQIYNDEKYFRVIRKMCMDYIEIEQDFFRNYVGGNFHAYLSRKRQDGVWGDDVEIQAISEIYNKPVEIYAYSSEPMRTFHEKSIISNHPIRLSYHGKSHYNSIVRINGNNIREENKENFGRIEELALKNAKNRVSRGKKELKDKKDEFRDILEEEVEEAIVLSRSDFETKGRRDMEAALEESMQLFHEKEKEIHEKSILQQTIHESLELLEKEKDRKMIFEPEIQNSTINRVMNEGFPLEIVLQAYSIVGDDFEAILKFIFENLL